MYVRLGSVYRVVMLPGRSLGLGLRRYIMCMLGWFLFVAVIFFCAGILAVIS